jgi:drug/metabolite transporter (DMT)-like permease
MVVYLLISIISTSSLFVLFKGFERFNINTLQAIVVNYWTAIAIGYLTTDSPLNIVESIDKPWFVHAVWLGLLFIVFFHLIAFASQKIGVAVTTTSNKMAVVIPIVVGIFFYGESAVWYKVLEKSTVKKSFLILILPVILFAGGGAMDVALNYVQKDIIQGFYVGEQAELETAWFSTSIFICAAALGTLVVLFQLLKGKLNINLRSILAGIILGIPNYASIYFLLRAIDTKVLGASALFPIANVGGILFATVASMIIFKEKLSRPNWVGVVLSVIGIFLIVLETVLNG